MRAGEFQILGLTAGGNQTVEGDGGDGPLPPHAEADFALGLKGIKAEKAGKSLDRGAGAFDRVDRKARHRPGNVSDV